MRIRMIENFYDDETAKFPDDADYMGNYTRGDTISKECIVGATLLSDNEAERYLTQDERAIGHKWWLRSKGLSQSTASYVDNAGYVRSDGMVDEVYHIRPALILEPLNLSAKKGDSFEFGGHIFKVVSKKMAVCDDTVGFCRFNRDWDCRGANSYSNSEVIWELDKWFKKAYREQKDSIK